MFDTEWGDTYLPDNWRDSLPSLGMRIGKAPVGFWVPDIEVVYGTSVSSLQKYTVMMYKNVMAKRTIDQGITGCLHNADRNVNQFGMVEEHVQLRYVRDRASQFYFTAPSDSDVLTVECYRHTLQPTHL